MLLTATWYLDAPPRARAARSCATRCPGTSAAAPATPKILDALEAYAMGARRRPVADTVDAPRRPTSVRGRRPAARRHRDFVEKVARHARATPTTGRCPGMLHGVVVRAQVPCATIESIDTAAARAVPGVRAVLTAADIPHNVVVEDASGLGIDPIVQPVLAADRVRYDGEPVAIVAAETGGGGARGGEHGRWSTTSEQPGVFDARGRARARRAGASIAGGNRLRRAGSSAIGDAEAALAARRRGRRGHLPQPARRPRLPGARGRHRLDRQRRRAHAARLHAGDRARPPDRRDPRSCPRAACA